MRLRLSEDGDLSAAAKGLTKLALDQGSVDNVSVVLVWFQDNTSVEGVHQHREQAPSPSSAALRRSGPQPHVPPD